MLASTRCFCLAARATRPTATSPALVYSPRRSLYAFAPSPSLLKKHSGAGKQAAAEFEEDFVEDEFDDADGLETPASSSSSTGRVDASLSQEERYAQHHATVTSALAGSHFKLHSFMPSHRPVVQLLTLTTPETVDSSLAILAKWRSRSLPPLPVDALIKKLVKYEQTTTIIQLLQDRTKYGVELKDVRGLDRLYAQLSKIGQAEQQDPSVVRPALEQARQLLDIVKFYLPEAADPVGPVMTLAPALLLANSPAATPQDKEVVATLLAEARQFAPEEVETVVLDEVRSSKVKKFVASRVLTIQAELEKMGGEEESLRWVKEIETGLAKYMPKRE